MKMGIKMKSVSVNVDDLVEETIEKFLKKASEIIKKTDADTLPEILHILENLWIAFITELNRNFLMTISDAVRKVSAKFEEEML